MPSPERIFFLAGVGTYQDSTHDLPLVPEELRDMRVLLSSLGFQDGAPQLADRAEIDPFELKDVLHDWVDARAAEQEQAGGERVEPPLVFVYVSGHGYWPENSRNQWYLTGREFDPKRRNGLLEPVELILPLIRRPGVVAEVMLVLDSCMSEAGSTGTMDALLNQWASLAEDLSLWILSSSYRNQMAEEMTFVRAFRAALSGGPRDRENLPVLELCERINGFLPPAQRAAPLRTTRASEGKVLPNPAHMTKHPPDWLPGEWQEWSAVARGVPAADRAGWYFTGRGDVLVDLVAALDPAEVRPVPQLVVGGMGSGKSALLGRLVLAGMPGSEMPPIARRGHLPAPGAVRAAMRIRQSWSVDDIATRLADQLGVRAGTPAELVAAIAEQRGVVGIVLDDVDRCERPDELAETLIVPLATTGVRLVMSARTPLDIGGARVVDLDSAHPAGVRELTDYLVLRATRTEDAPLAGREDLVRSVTHWVAPMCASNFGIAALIANDLTGAHTHKRWLTETGADWQKRVGELVFGLFRQAVGDVVPETANLFAPLRLDGGAWLPESLWIDLAAASGVHRHTAAEIGAVADAAGSLLERKVVEDEPWWRLRVPPPRLDWPVQGVTDLLLAVVPKEAGRYRWPSAHPELLRLLVLWSSLKADLLESLLADQELLVNVRPVPIAGQVGNQGKDIKALLEAWHSVHAAGMATEERRLLLALLVGWRELEIDGVEVGRPFVRVDWAMPSDRDRGAIVHLAVHRRTAVTGHDDGTATLWSLPPGGGALGVVVDEGDYLVSALAVAPGEHPSAVVARRNRRITVLAAGMGPAVELLAVEGRPVESMAFVDEATLVFTHASGLSCLDTGSGTTRRLWAPTTLKLDRVTVATPERPVLVVGTRSGDVLVRDHFRQTVTGVLYRGDEAVTHLSTSPGGDTVSVVGAGGTLTVHRVTTHEQVARLGITHPARVAVSDRWLVVAGGGRRPSLAVHDIEHGAVRVLELVLPTELTGVAFLDDDTVLLAAADGLAQLTLDRDLGGTDEG
ncbi:hypothetical protein IOD16_06480 [Saccharothrix sp. 6-C]|uniref:hypothetical protein n=1 Tax=Saccharothrix sp. 6-C TaxID=2781735 RepID=UPI001917480F|nr:hypothetical protein [Saccharothrix sp. 6-C]QQQ78118.1 hypothetical protein IOD16_06480 [Saccharothrix sp. 6-C]